MGAAPGEQLHAWVEYLRDMGVYDLYRRSSPGNVLPASALERLRAVSIPEVSASVVRPAPASSALPVQRPAQPARGTQIPQSGATAGRSNASPRPAVQGTPVPAAAIEVPQNYFRTDEGMQQLPPELAAPMPKPNPLEDLFPLASAPIPAGERAAALASLQEEIGDCTRCPLAYAGRHTIVFGEGDPSAELMFVGEGPGADEDTSGRPFVGKAGQLLNNMIGAMGLQREQVFIANIVKCRPPGNRTPEFVEATTCSQFLLKQIDIVRPRVIVALGSTAATYLLGVRQSLTSLRGQWLASRGAKVAVTYHPAFLLRDPRQKSEAWKDLQRVMVELGLKPPAKQ